MENIKEKMLVKKSFTILLQTIFILFSLYLISEAFYMWDGYSLYVPFIEFLSDISLVYIIWSVIGLIVSTILWIVAYGVFRMKSISIRLEYSVTWIILIVLSMIIGLIADKYMRLGGFTGINSFTVLLISCVIATFFVWFFHSYAGRILDEITFRIKPLTFVCLALFLIAAPLSVHSVFKQDIFTSRYVSNFHEYSVDKRPNVILVTWDALTSKDMELYGYNRTTTPYITQWAKDSIVFQKAYSGSNWTTPSVMSLMTGQRSWTHRVWYTASNFPSRTYLDSLPRILRDYGYSNYAFVQNKHAHPDFIGIGANFKMDDHYYTFKTGYRSNSLLHKVSLFFLNRPIVREFMQKYPLLSFENIVKMIIHPRMPHNSDGLPDTITPPDLIYNRFLKSITERTIKQPFFAWLHTNPPHDPYLPPKPYAGMYGDIEKTADIMKRWGDLHRPYNPEQQKEVDIFRKRYDEFLLYSDEQFRLFMDNLAKSVDLSNTIIIFSADHGESFSNNVIGHGFNKIINEPTIRIPLIIKIPENKTGRFVDMPVSQIDIAPTILELTGLPIPVWMEGRSLVPFINGNQMERRPVLISNFIKNHARGKIITNGAIAIIDGDYKLVCVLEEKKVTLYNLKFDPDESNNIIEKEPEIAQRLLRIINEELAKANMKITLSHRE
ncbi:MAG: sulfatase-like hydrolase/transferase [Nitrospirae bacterium]|nr:sulfatase-like hydrolase/transferase [Nitrospirota bacterium]